MEPFTIAAVVAVITGLIGGGVGYAFGSAADEERFNALQAQIAKQAKALAEYEKQIEQLCREIEVLRESRGTFRRFMWFVFKSDPKLYELFAELERQERSRREARAGLVVAFSTMRQEFPEHPAAKAVAP